MNKQITTGFLSALVGLGFLLSGCANTKNTTYFQDISDSLYHSSQSLNTAAYTNPLIHSNDILQISVQTIDPNVTSSMGTQSTSTYNVQGSSAAAGGGQAVQGYMVDKEGFVELPLVGKIKLAGLSTESAREVIKQKAAIYYKDPVVNVRLANFYVSVLGEVTHPSQYIIPNEKASILDAIALAGDLTIYGKRDNVLLLREENGVKKATRFDLRSSAIYENPYFFLRQGDVIYVEANKQKVAASDVRMLRSIAIITSVASLMVAVIYRLGK